MPRETGQDDFGLVCQLWELTHALRAMSTRMERQLGLTGLQRLVLRAVQREPGIASTELARELGLPAGTAGSLVERLVDRGLLERDADEPHRLRLPSAGATLLAVRRPTIESTVAEARSALPRGAAREGEKLIVALTAALRAAAGEEAP